MNKKNLSASFIVLFSLLLVGAGCPIYIPRGPEEQQSGNNVSSESTENVQPTSGQDDSGSRSTNQEKRRQSDNEENDENENENESVSATVAPTASAPTQASAPTAAQTTASPAVGGQKTYTIAQVQAANTPNNCLTVISGVVYDLTAWINRHPGGDKNILSLCGLDGTAAYNSVHAGQSKPANVLAGFEIGLLK